MVFGTLRPDFELHFTTDWQGPANIGQVTLRILVWKMGIEKDSFLSFEKKQQTAKSIPT